MPALPSGVIILWSGSVASIPGGWVLCDGANGSPNLTSKFIVGAGDTYDPDDTGGNPTHNHSFTGDGHTHTLQAGMGYASGVDFGPETDTDAGSGTTGISSNIPPYYALCYIMKT